MCFAIPEKILKIKGQEAEIAKKRIIDITLLPGVKPGDWVLSNGNLAIKKINQKEAKDFFLLTKNK